MTIRYVNYRREFPQTGAQAFRKWFSMRRYWGGKLTFINIRHHALVLDFRKDVLGDLMRPD